MRVLGLEFVAAQIAADVRDLHAGVGLEEAARRERFAALAGVVRSRGADAIALAHHVSDQAETVLLHLLRGAGQRGMSGIAEWTVRRVPWWEPDTRTGHTDPIAIWRPFIAEPKDALESYVHGLGLTPIVDPSNDSVEFKRNRIRHEVLPLLEEISAGSTAAIVRYSQLAAAEDEYLDTVAQAHLDASVDQEGRLRAEVVAELDIALQRRIIRTWLRSGTPTGVDVGQERVDAVRELGLAGQGQSRIQIGSGWQVVRRAGLLHLERAAE
ncbi:MAG TPA: tRNA lysidine(34) synthetase TilS [Nitrospiraceae bacterium]|nr:tRNA lysidine(34) synthetase TilS [Nitrospiraceae bacterium]